MTPNEIATNISGTAAGMENVTFSSTNYTFTITGYSGGNPIRQQDDKNNWD